MNTLVPNVAYAPLVNGLMPALAIEFPVNPIAAWLWLLAALVVACAALSFLTSLPLRSRRARLRLLRPSMTTPALPGQA